MIERIAMAIKSRIRSIHNRRAENKRIGIMVEAERRIQVREFDGMLCLSIDGIPVMPMREFNRQTLSDARLTLYNYLTVTRNVQSCNNRQVQEGDV